MCMRVIAPHIWLVLGKGRLRRNRREFEPEELGTKHEPLPAWEFGAPCALFLFLSVFHSLTVGLACLRTSASVKVSVSFWHVWECYCCSHLRCRPIFNDASSRKKKVAKARTNYGSQVEFRSAVHFHLCTCAISFQKKCLPKASCKFSSTAHMESENATSPEPTFSKQAHVFPSDFLSIQFAHPSFLWSSRERTAQLAKLKRNRGCMCLLYNSSFECTSCAGCWGPNCRLPRLGLLFKGWMEKRKSACGLDSAINWGHPQGVVPLSFSCYSSPAPLSLAFTHSLTHSRTYSTRHHYYYYSYSWCYYHNQASKQARA